MHRENINEDFGSARLIPNDPVKVNTKGTWKIEFTAGKKGIQIGGTVRLTIPHGFSLPQTKAFFDPGFVTIESECEGIEFSTEVISDIFCRLDEETGHSGAWGRNLFITIQGKAMKEGDKFTVVYGNNDYYGGEPFSKTGALTRELSGDAMFIVAVDPNGDRNAPFSGYTRINKVKDFPTLQLLPAKPYKYKIIARSFVDSKKKALMAKVLKIDEFNNPIDVEERQCKIEKDRNSTKALIKLNDSFEKTNPVKILGDNDTQKIFWGDIHGHTIHSDGLGNIDEYFTFAKETAQLDFTAITDHDDIGPRLAQDEFNLLKKKVAEYNEPGNLVTFLGHEYRNGKCDMNIYFPEEDGEILRGNEQPYQDSLELTKKMKEWNGMIIPHMHFGADWSGYDPEIYRLIEIYSSHGCAEYKDCPREIPYLQKQVQKSSETNRDTYIQSALNLGFRMGTTAGSDTHSGRPGYSDWTRVTRTYMGGLTAVFAEKLTREAIWDALYQKKCYATTGNRSLLQFSVNDHMMGSEITISDDEKINIHASCYADGFLTGYRIYRNGEILFSDDELSGDYFEKEFECEPKGDSDWYYIRFDLEEGEMVWSTPIWVDKN